MSKFTTCGIVNSEQTTDEGSIDASPWHKFIATSLLGTLLGTLLNRHHQIVYFYIIRKEMVVPVQC